MQPQAPLIRLLIRLAWALICAPVWSHAINFWGRPDCTSAYMEEPEGRGCHFPSRGPDGDIRECQNSRDGLWCPTSADYCSDGRFRWCPGTDSTYGGTDPGKLCHFPFAYKGEQFRHCIRRDTRGENYLWCSTTPGNYTGRWTRCRELSHLMPCRFSRQGSGGIERQCIYQSRQWLCQTARGDRRVCDDTDSTEGGNDPGQPCSFPFKYNGVRHSECLKHSAEGEEYIWCATTANFDRDHLWTMCKQRTGFRLEGLLLLLVVVASAVLGACALAYLVHCLCEHAKPLCLRLCTKERRPVTARRQRIGRLDAGAEEAERDDKSPSPPPPPLTPTAPPPYEDIAFSGSVADLHMQAHSSIRLP